MKQSRLRQKNTVQSTEESNTISVSLKESKIKDSSNEDSLPILTKSLSGQNNGDIAPEVKKEKKKKAIINEDLAEVKIKQAADNSEKDDFSSSKTKRNTAAEDSIKISAVESTVDLEERNLAPPTKTKSKSRSKSPRDPEETATDRAFDLNKETATLETSAEDQNSLMPILKTKTRSKSPKNTEEVSAVTENSLLEAGKQESSVDDLCEKPVKVSKKKKKQLLEDNEYSTEKQSSPTDTTLLSTGDSQTMKSTENKEASQLLVSETVSLGKSESATDSNEEKQPMGKSSKSSRKSAKLIENAVENSGETALEIPASVATSESSVTKKKHRKPAEEPVTVEQEMAPVASNDKSFDGQCNNAEQSQTFTADSPQPAEKPKKKKSSKTSAETKSEQPSGDSTIANEIMLDVPKQTVEPNFARLATKEAANEILVDTRPSSDAALFSASEKVLEQAVVEKFDAVAMNEVQDLPNNEITIVKPITDPRETKTKVEDLIPTSSNDITQAPVTISEHLPQVPNISVGDNQVPPDSESTKQSSDALNEEIARYLESFPSPYKSPNIDATAAEISQQIEKPLRSIADEKSVEDENSEFTYRRQSMDDFIKKILAEAREERQKLKGDIGEDGDDATTKTLAGADSSVNRVAQNGEALSPLKTENDFLERRVTSTENKRLPNEDKMLAAGSSERIQHEILMPSASKVKSLDGDSEVTRILNARRAQKKAMGEATNYDDIEGLINEGGPSRFKGRYGPRGMDDYPDDDESITSAKATLSRSRVQRPDIDEPPGKSDSFLAKYRRERDASQLPEDAFTPRRSDQTDDVIRDRTRHIRIIVEQQADVAKSLLASSRCMDELDNEIRDVRQLSLDWQARIEALETAVDAEYRTYELDQQTGAERLHQQHMPDDRYLREELRNSMRPRRAGDRLRGESAEDEGFGPGLRRRSGSVASVATSVGSGFMAGRGDSGLELDYVLSGLGGTARRDTRRDGDLDFSTERSRRAGSLTGDKLAGDNLGLAGDNDNYGLPPRTSRGAPQKNELATSPQPSEEVMRIRAKYSSLSNDGVSSYNLPGRSSGLSDIGSSSYLSSGSSHLSDSRGGVSSRRSDAPLSSSRYGDPSSSSSSRYSGAGSYGVSSLSPLESTRMRRAQSVTEVNADRPSYRSGAYNDPVSDFRSKYLSRTQGKGDDLSNSSSLSYGGGGGAGMRSKDRPFKSRFLRSGVGLSNGTGGGVASHDSGI